MGEHSVITDMNKHNGKSITISRSKRLKMLPDVKCVTLHHDVCLIAAASLFINKLWKPTLPWGVKTSAYSSFFKVKTENYWGRCQSLAGELGAVMCETSWRRNYVWAGTDITALSYTHMNTYWQHTVSLTGSQSNSQTDKCSSAFGYVAAVVM